MSYDFYGLLPDGRVHWNYFSNLDLVRSKTLGLRKPFWVITQTGQLDGRKKPTEKEERWSVWSNIAVGSKGIAYFCYWDPIQNGSGGTAMINRDGSKTEFYGWIKQINSDINTIGKKLLPCHADGAIMDGTIAHPLYDNSGTGRTKYGPVKSVVGTQEVLCGCFRDARISENGDNYKGYKVLVMSQMPNRTITATLTLDSSVNKITFTHNNTTQMVDLYDALNTTVGSISISFENSVLTLGIPDGEAVLLEF